MDPKVEETKKKVNAEISQLSEAEPKNSEMELAKLVLDDAVKTSYFRKFLESEHNNENLLFWIDANEYSNTHAPEKRREMARRIYDKYVSSSAELMVNLPSNIKKDIEVMLQERKEDPPLELYLKARDEIFSLLSRDPFPRFMKTVGYLSLASGGVAPTLDARIHEQLINLAEQPCSDDGFYEADSPDPDVTISFLGGEKDPKTGKRDPVTVRGSCLIPFPPKDIFDILITNSTEERERYDDMAKSLSVVENIGEGLSIMRIKYKSPSILVKKRDFVYLRLSRQLPDGTYIIVNRSIDHPSAPTKKSYIRGEIFISGWVLKRSETNPSFCRATAVAQVDPRGSIPVFFLNGAKTNSAMIVARVRDYLKERERERAKGK